MASEYPIHTEQQVCRILGPVHMEASQPAYLVGALCRDLTSSLIAIQNLMSVHVSRRSGGSGPLSEISLEYWRDFGRRDEKFLM